MNLTTFQEEVRARLLEKETALFEVAVSGSGEGWKENWLDIFDLLTSSTTEAHSIGKDEGIVLGLKRALELLPEAKGKAHPRPTERPQDLNDEWDACRAEIETALTAELTSLERGI